MSIKKVSQFNIDEHIITCDASHRGGTLKVDVSNLFPYVDDAVMGAYCNYLGGGLRGAIVGASMFTPDELKEKDKKIFFELKEKIKQYFYSLTNDGESELEEMGLMSYEQNQRLAVSAY